MTGAPPLSPAAVRPAPPEAGPPAGVFVLCGGVACGFPSPADDHAETRLDLDAYLIRRPAATFFVRFAGESLLGVGIHDGDLGIVDRSLTPRAGDVVVALAEGSLVAKVFRRRRGGPVLETAPADPIEAAALRLSDESDVQIWGVVSASVRFHRRPEPAP